MKFSPRFLSTLRQAAMFLRASLAALLLCALTSLAGPASAQDVTYTDTELLSALESSYWIAATAPAPKKVYVIAADWCPVCAQFHEMVAKGPAGAEYRFILTAPHSQAGRAKIGRAAFSRSPAALAKVYSGAPDGKEPPTPAEAYAAGVNESLLMAIKAALMARTGEPLGVPLLIFRSAGQLRVVSGLPSDLAALSSTVDETDGPSSVPARLAALNAKPPKLTPVTPRPAYARQDGTALRIAPDPSAAKFAGLKAGAGFMLKAETVIDGERWYAFQFAADGPPAAFGKAGDFR
jgi:hypothetical protein